jgi:hypothetical protein
MRICTVCGTTKAVSEFTRIKSAGYYGPCRWCRARRSWEERHPGSSYAEWLRDRAAADAALAEVKPKATMRTWTDCG